MDYSEPKLYIPKKGNDWYVHFRVLNPDSGKREQHKERRDINRIKDLRERKKKFILLAKSLSDDLASGWRPLEQHQKDIEKDKNRLNFYWWFEERLKYSESKHGYYNHRKLTTVYNKLKEYAPTLLVKDLDRKFIQDYEIHLIKEGCSANYIADILTRIKIVVKEIIDSGDMQHHKNPFLKLKFATTRVKKERLNESDMQKLIDVRLTHKLEMLARDMYLLSYYSAGIRFGDLCRLKPEMFKNRRLVYEMHKTFQKKKERNILMTDKAHAIYKKYLKNGEYLFPLKIDWENEDKSIGSANAMMNKYLKKACERAEIAKITFHTSRNSFADHSVKNGIGTRQLKELFAHSKEATTEIYMADYYQEETDEAMKKMFGKKTK